MTRETRAVLGGAYKAKSPKNLLTHSVEVDDEGNEQKVLCGRVNPDSLADSNAHPVDAVPSCPRCQKTLLSKKTLALPPVSPAPPMLKKVSEVDS